jgi:protein SCO1/2
MRNLYRSLIAVLAFALAIGAGYWFGRGPTEQQTASTGPVAPTFELVDHNNRPLTQEHLKGKWSFLFFGYTYCPDICPMALGVLSLAHKQIMNEPGLDEDLQFIFISVDPERDTPERLKQFVGYFDDSFIGATGSRQQIDALTGPLQVAYRKVAGQTPEDYVIDHSAQTFLVGPDGRLRYSMIPHDPASVVAKYKQIRSNGG